MRVMIVSCSYLLYEHLLKLKENVLGLVLGLVILSSASWFCPRPRPRPRPRPQEFGLDQHHCLTVTDYRGHRQTLLPVREINLKACAPVILKQFILPGLGIEPRPG